MSTLDTCLLGVISAELVNVVSMFRPVLNVTEMFNYECLQEIKLHISLQVFAFNTEEIEREG